MGERQGRKRSNKEKGIDGEVRGGKEDKVRERDVQKDHYSVGVRGRM